MTCALCRTAFPAFARTSTHTQVATNTLSPKAEAHNLAFGNMNVWEVKVTENAINSAIVSFTVVSTRAVLRPACLELTARSTR